MRLADRIIKDEWSSAIGQAICSAERFFVEDWPSGKGGIKTNIEHLQACGRISPPQPFVWMEHQMACNTWGVLAHWVGDKTDGWRLRLHLFCGQKDGWVMSKQCAEIIINSDGKAIESFGGRLEDQGFDFDMRFGDLFIAFFLPACRIISMTQRLPPAAMPEAAPVFKKERIQIERLGRPELKYRLLPVADKKRRKPSDPDVLKIIGKALHSVDAHWRRLQSGVEVPVSEHERGDAKYGIVVKDRVVRRKAELVTA